MGRMNIMNAGTCYINGRAYKNISGVITIENGRTLVNGKPIEDWSESNEKVINITIEGNVEALDVMVCNTITVNGDAKKVKTGSGNVSVKGNVSGDIQTGSGDVECGDVGGDASTGSGDIRCGNVQGRVSTGSGDVYRK